MSAERNYMNRKIKGQFKTASKLNAKVVITLGDAELEQKEVNFKVMKTGNESKVPLKEVYKDFEKLFNLKVADMTAFNDFFNKED